MEHREQFCWKRADGWPHTRRLCHQILKQIVSNCERYLLIVWLSLWLLKPLIEKNTKGSSVLFKGSLLVIWLLQDLDFHLKETSQIVSPSLINSGFGLSKIYSGLLFSSWLNLLVNDIQGKNCILKLRRLYFYLSPPTGRCFHHISLTWLFMSLWVCADSYTKAKRRFCYKETGLYVKGRHFTLSSKHCYIIKQWSVIRKRGSC